MSAGRRNHAWESVGLFDLLDGFERDLGADRPDPPSDEEVNLDGRAG